MSLSICLIVCLLHIFSFANANEDKYIVIAPGTIHSHEKYTAAVSIHHTSQACQLKVGITGPSYNETKQVEVSQNEVKHVEFDLPSLEVGDYNLTTEGVNCMGNFKNSTKLIYNQFHNHIKIQTDKVLYKPGDEVKFRVLFLDKNLRPAEPNKDDIIWFEDSNGNRIKEIKGFKSKMGVYTDEFKISENPVTGRWRLGVENGEPHRFIYFNVYKHVLPKYVVKVEAPKAVSVKDGDMQVIVRANYTYGKPLNGKATVVLSHHPGYLFEDKHNLEASPILTKTADIVNGKAKFNFNLKEYEPHLPHKQYSSSLKIVATTEEKFTGVQIKDWTFSSIFPFRYTMNCISYHTCSTFEADKETEVLFQLRHIDNSFLNDTKSSVELIYKEVLRTNYRRYRTTTKVPPISGNSTVSFKGHMNETGFVNFKVSLPGLPEYDGYRHYYSLDVKYLDEQREVYSVSQSWQPQKVDVPTEKSKEYFILMHKYFADSKLFLNKADQFTLKSSRPLPYFNYHVIGRGDILKSGRVDLSDKPKVYNLTLTPEHLWAPSFGVYVYYVDENGEYHYAEQEYDIDFYFELENQINITAAEEVKPGGEVALKIQTTPNSYVGLTAVDQSILLLSSTHDLHPLGFNSILGLYKTKTPDQGGFSEYPGTKTGCITLTNADYFYNWTMPNYMKTFGRGDHYDMFNRTPYKIPKTAASDIKVREGFSETWLFTDIENTETDEFIWKAKIPETITTWILTAFAMSSTKGLGITRQKTKVKTVQPFFISIRLPYSLKRGEIINVPALVFNYLEKDLDVEITLDNSDNEYEHIEFDNEVVSQPKRTKSIRVPTNGVAGASFLIRPTIVGNVLLKFIAISPIAGDAIHKTLKVVAEGITQYVNRAYFINLNNEPEYNNSFELELPKDLVPDSHHVEVNVMNDIMGPILNNLGNLVRIPTGCGEETMSTLLPNYLVLKYLMNSTRLTPAIQATLIHNLESGYQNILNYGHSDGSFSNFGPSYDKEKPRNGSTWMTAYVVRYLGQIKRFANVNEKIIKDGLAFLSRQQAENGTFTEKGDFFYASKRNHISITSATILAFLENPNSAEKYAQEIAKGLDFIVNNIGKSESLHAQSLGTYTLYKAKHTAAKKELSKLKSLAKTDSDHMWWSAGNTSLGGDAVEITSYNLLTLLDQNTTKVADVLPIIKWLIAQRNSYGGFALTQDTVVGLTALLNFIKFSDYKPAQMDVDIVSMDKNETIELTEDNRSLYEIVKMPPKTKLIEFNAKGNGSALVQIAYQYNIYEIDRSPSFTIETEILENINSPSHLVMSVCVNYVGEGESSNMALLEISTPSGYVIDWEKLTAIKELQRVSNTELKNSDSMLIAYFDHLYKNDKICLIVEALRTHAVAMQKPASIRVYDYYDTNRKATVFYDVNTKLCDICETEEECKKCK